jgi:hypothetical protein
MKELPKFEYSDRYDMSKISADLRGMGRIDGKEVSIYLTTRFGKITISLNQRYNGRLGDYVAIELVNREGFRIDSVKEWITHEEKERYLPRDFLAVEITRPMTEGEKDRIRNGLTLPSETGEEGGES